MPSLPVGLENSLSRRVRMMKCIDHQREIRSGLNAPTG